MTDTERLYKAFEDILYCRRPIIKPAEDKESGIEKVRKIMKEAYHTKLENKEKTDETSV